MFSRKDKPAPHQQAAQARYQQLVKELSPRSKLGQALLDLGKNVLHMKKTAAGAFGSSMLVLLTALLTALGVFDKIGQYAGAGSFVPITGFANSMVSAAMEFRREGMILGMGSKLFTIAGPVLVWGVSTSVVTGIIYFIVHAGG